MGSSAVTNVVDAHIQQATVNTNGQPVEVSAQGTGNTIQTKVVATSLTAALGVRREVWSRWGFYVKGVRDLSRTKLDNNTLVYSSYVYTIFIGS